MTPFLSGLRLGLESAFVRHECISRLRSTAFGHSEFLPNSTFTNKAKNKDVIWIHDSLFVWAEVRIMISIHEQRDMNLY